MKKLNKKGFTLTEMIVVIAIIGILAAVLIPSVIVYVNKARLSNDQQLAASMTDEIERYCYEYNVDQSKLLGTDIKTILTFKDFDLEPASKNWTYVYNKLEKNVQVVDVDDIKVDTYYVENKASDPTNYAENLYLLGEGKNAFEKAVNSLCNLKSTAEYDSIIDSDFRSLIQKFNPNDTLFVGNSAYLTNVAKDAEVKKIVYLVKTIHLPSANDVKFNESSKFYKSAIIKTCDDNSEFKNLFTNLHFLNNQNIKEISVQIDVPEENTSTEMPSITFDSLVNDAKEISISSELVSVISTKLNNQNVLLVTRKLVITYYNESGVYARGSVYYNLIETQTQSNN